MAHSDSPNSRRSGWTISSRLAQTLRVAAAVALFVPTATCGDSTAPEPVATKLAIDAALSAVVAGSPITLKVELTDDQGESVLKATGSVTVAIASGTGVAGAKLSGTLTATATQGEVTFTGLSIDKAGSGYKLVVSAANLASATSPSFDVAPGAPALVTVNAGDSQTATVGSAVSVAPSVLVKDAMGNVVPNANVTFAVASGGGSVTGGAQTTNASGIATVGGWTLGTTVGANTLSVTVGAITPTIISATGAAGVPTQVAVNGGNAQTAVAGAAVAVAPSVIVKDAYGNAVGGANVTFAVATGGGSITGGTATTSASGVASVGAWTLGKTMGGNSLTASVVGITPVTISATGTAGAPTQVAVNGGNTQTAVAGVAVAVAPSVVVKDVNDNAVSGVSVTFTVASGDGTVTGGTATTNASGVASVGAWTLGKAMGANTLTAAVAGITPVTISATGIAGAPTQVAISAGNAQTAIAGVAVSVAPSVVVKDVNDNVVSGASVTFTVASGGGSITGGAATTNASGVASVGSWTLGRTMGGNTLTATVGSVTPITISATGIAGAPSQVAVSAGNAQTAIAGAAVAVAPSVVVKDANDNVVSGANVTFTVASGGGSITGGAATTNASGVAAVGSWTLGTTMGGNTLTATVGGVTPVTILATGTAGAPTQVAVNSGNAQTAVAGSAVTTAPSVIVKDANNNVVSGASVTFAVATGGGSITGGATTTNASGVASVGSWTLGATKGANTLSVTVGSIAPVTIAATGTAGAPTQVAVNSGNAQTAVAGSVVTTAPSVVVKDANNNVVSGASVTFAVATGGGSITGASATTNVSGVATLGSWTLGATMGANTLTVTVGSITPLTIAATGTAGAPTQAAVSAGNAQTAVAGVAVAVAPSVVVKDANNNVVSGASVTFAVATGGGSVTGGTATTNASGIATVGAWTLGTTMGANTMTATVASVTPVSFSATGTAGAAKQVAVNGGNSQSATAGAAVATPPSVIVKDVNGNVVSGASVTFAVASGGGAVAGGAVTTNASGIASVGSWTLGTTAGANTLTATVATVTPVVISATGVVGPVTQFAINAGNSQTATAGSAVAVKPSVIVKDVNGNVASGVAVTFAISAGGGALTGATTTTDANGIATVGSWTTGTTVGLNTITATATGLSVSPLTISATGVAGAAAKLAATGGASQGTAGLALGSIPTVVATDANNNIVSGVSVTFAVASGGGSITGGSTTTGSDGSAKVSSWTLGATAGANTLTATAPGLTGSPVTLTATGLPGNAHQILLNAGDGQTQVAGSAVTTKPSVIVKDVNGNAVSGVSIQFDVATGGGAVTAATQTTDANGIATVGGWTLGTTMGANSVTATSSGLNGSPVTFSASGIAGAAAQWSVNTGGDQTAIAGAAVATPPSVIVKDANGNPVSGTSVTFAVTGGAGSITGGTQTTDATGVATVGSWTLGTTVNNNYLNATSPTFSGSTLSFHAGAVAGPATQMQVVQDQQVAVAGSAISPIPIVIARDVNNNPVSGVNVTFAVTGGGGSITGAAKTTNGDGFAQVDSWTLGTTAGSNTMTASATGLSTVTLHETGIAGAATQLALVSGNNQTATVGTSLANSLVIEARDANNNPVSNVPVSWSTPTGFLSWTSFTNSSGSNSAGWLIGTTAGAMTATVSSSGLANSPLTFSATGTAGPAWAITSNAGNGVSATVGTAVATKPTALVTDQYSNPIAGVQVTFSNDFGSSTITGTTQTTNASGLATIGSWTLGTVAQQYGIKASATGLGDTRFSATATPGAATQIALFSGDNSSATVATGVTDVPVVIVTDAYNNAVSGKSVTFAVASGGGSLTAGTATSDNDGKAAVGSWTLGTAAGSNTMTATATGLTGSPVTFTATGTAGAATQIALKSGNNQTGTVHAQLSVDSLPRVIVKDTYGNPTAGVTITWDVTAGGGTTFNATSTTGSDGVARPDYWLLGNTVGTNTLTATLGNLTPISFSATAVAGEASSMEINAGNNQTATVNTATSVKPSVLVKDAYGNVVSGFGVTFNINGTEGSITGENATTNASGVATIGSWTLGTTAGGNELWAQAPVTSGSLLIFSATATAGAISHISYNSVANQLASPSTAVSAKPSLSMTDVYGNPISGVGVTFAVTAGGGSVTGGSATTGADGIATVGSWTTGSTITGNSMTASITGQSRFTFRADYLTNVKMAQTHSCAQSTGSAFCWGANYNGQLGTGDGNWTMNPVSPAGGLLLSGIVLGGDNSACGLTSAGKAYCWGNNSNGQIGNNSTNEADTPQPVNGNLTFTALAAGQDHVCGLVGGKVYCWGRNDHGQMGDADTDEPHEPKLVIDTLSFVSIAAGDHHTCALTSSGAAYCWGFNNRSQLGNNDFNDATSPVLVQGGLSFASITAGRGQTCGVTSAGAGYCWGANLNGEAGANLDPNTSFYVGTPTAVSGGYTWASISAGSNHTCGVTTAGAGYCWGFNYYNQLGDGGNTQSIVPVAVAGSLTWSKIGAGQYGSCGLTTARALYCWGNNQFGEVGVGDRSPRSVPTAVVWP